MKEIWVDAEKGNDADDGTSQKPVKTLDRALKMADKNDKVCIVPTTGKNEMSEENKEGFGELKKYYRRTNSILFQIWFTAKTEKPEIEGELEKQIRKCLADNADVLNFGITVFEETD